MIAPDVTAAITNLNTLTTQVKAGLVERDDLVDLIALATLGRQNIFVAGVPGVAKSKVFMDFFAGIGGAKTGYYALTKGSTPETVVGPISLRALKDEDRLRFNTEGMLPDNDFVFIDEVFKGNSLTRAAMLQVLNERIFFNGGEIVDCPLNTAGAASNEYPDAREDAAFYDRMLIRYEVDRIKTHQNRMKMIRLSLAQGVGGAIPHPVFDLSELRLLQQARDQVAITDETERTFLEIYTELSGLGSDGIVGDRRLAHTFLLVQAKALLAGRTETQPSDLAIFAHTAWTLPETRKQVQKLITRAIAPEVAEITDMYDEAETGFETFLRERAEANAKRDMAAVLAAYKRFGDAAGEQIREMKGRIEAQMRAGKTMDDAVRLLRRTEGRVQEAMALAITGDQNTV